MVEQVPLKDKVQGSSPCAGTIIAVILRPVAVFNADVAELADALVLGTSGVTRGGSTPSIRTIAILLAEIVEAGQMRTLL